MTKPIRIVAYGDSALRNALLSKATGGTHVEAGLAEMVASDHPGYEAKLEFREYGGLSELRDTSTGIEADVVILAMAPDVRGLAARSADPHQAISGFHDDLVAVVDKVKEAADAHVLVVNVSTFDPADQTSSLHGLTEEPLSMRAHRINLALLQISHEIGISIIDADRITAEAGCGSVVPAALEISAEGSALVRDETVRVLADYGFFDERSLVAQVGNRGGK